MPLFQVDIQKSYNGEFWTNRYIVSATDIATANTKAAPIVAAERAIHKTLVLFDKYRVSDMDPATDSYFVFAINAYGQRAATSEYLPLFNVLRCDFNIATGGRPSRKYLRLPLEEADQSNMGDLSGALLTAAFNDYVTPLVGLAGFVDVDGEEITSGSVYPKIGMRQLRRGSKRKLTPIIT